MTAGLYGLKQNAKIWNQFITIMHGQELKDGNKLFITAILMLNFGSRILNFNNQ